MEVDGAGEYFSLISYFLPDIYMYMYADCLTCRIFVLRVAVIGELVVFKVVSSELADISGLTYTVLL